jgi:hypothetical protein
MNATGDIRRDPDPTGIRFGERIELDLPVTLDAGNGLSGTGVLRNISISGALVDTGLELPVFANLVVSLPAMGQSLPPCKLAACVVRQAPTGAAIEWRDMACTSLLEVLSKAWQDARQRRDPSAR